MKKKLLMSLGMVVCAALLVVGSVMGTMAYLTSRKTVTNTFSFGNVAITLDESMVDPYGVPVTPAKRVETGNGYKLIPGQTYTKDPRITVAKGSEECYLYVKLDHDLDLIEIAKDDTNDPNETETIVEQLAANGWKELDGYQGKVFYYTYTKEGTLTDKVKPTSDADVVIPVFQNFTVRSEVSSTTIDGFGIRTIVVTAYAVQTAGFDDVKDAFDTAFKNNG